MPRRQARHRQEEDNKVYIEVGGRSWSWVWFNWLVEDSARLVPNFRKARSRLVLGRSGAGVEKGAREGVSGFEGLGAGSVELDFLERRSAVFVFDDDVRVGVEFVIIPGEREGVAL